MKLIKNLTRNFIISSATTLGVLVTINIWFNGLGKHVTNKIKKIFN